MVSVKQDTKQGLAMHMQNYIYKYFHSQYVSMGFLGGSVVKNLPQALGWENALEKEMATHSSILAWEIP